MPKSKESSAYLRDGRAPVPVKESTSRVMRANKARGTGPELALRRALSTRGLRGYRLHSRKLPGHPDIVFPQKRVAIFVHGCFWHRCPHCKKPLPKSNRGFWKMKFRDNARRHARQEKALERDGWRVLVFWECEVRRNVQSLVEKVAKALDKRMQARMKRV